MGGAAAPGGGGKVKPLPEDGSGVAAGVGVSGEEEESSVLSDAMLAAPSSMGLGLGLGCSPASLSPLKIPRSSLGPVGRAGRLPTPPPPFGSDADGGAGDAGVVDGRGSVGLGDDPLLLGLMSRGDSMGVGGGGLSRNASAGLLGATR